MEEIKGSFVVQTVKAVFLALIVALIAVVIFAGVVKLASLNDGVIKAVNQFIKVLSVFLGCFFCVKDSKGLIKGLLVGALSAVLITLVFALITDGVSFGLGFVIDLVFMGAVGAISGIISVNLKS